MLQWIRAVLAFVCLAALAAVVAWARLAAPDAHPVASTPMPGPVAVTRRTPLPPADCARPEALAAAAAGDAASLETALWSPSSRPEAGWQAYAPLAAQEVGTACPPGTPGFSAALDAWRRGRGLAVAGPMDEATLKAMALQWLLRRPFVQATRAGECPPAPDPAALASALPGETYGGKAVQALPSVLEAWRRLKDAARRDVPEVAADPHLFAIASGFRGPEEEAARCGNGGCDSVSRAHCSAHRTGTALDLMLTPQMSFSTDPANRTALARSPAYLWLVRNAGRFGFVPYAYEPWHWEWAPESARG